MKPNNKIIAVTGGASGIGFEICKKFGSKGWKVALIDVNEKEAIAKKEILNEMGIMAMAIECDVSEYDQCVRAINSIVENWGDIHVIVNNAGITQRSAFVDTDISVYRKVMDINFFGSINCSIAAKGALIKSRGQIIIISSVAGFAPILGRSGYCASKHALHGFFGVVRSELKQYGISVTLICPGFTQTNLQSRALDGNGTITKHPQSYVGKQYPPRYVAEAVYKAVLKPKRMIVLTPVGKISLLLMKLSPTIFEKLQERKLKKELKR